MAKCLGCGLVKYHDCSAHAKRNGHHIVQLDDPEDNDASVEVQLFCFITDSKNQQYLFNKPCPYVAIERVSHDRHQVKEGDVVLLATNEKIGHCTRLMESENDASYLSTIDLRHRDYVYYYIQTVIALPQSKTMEDAAHKWSSAKNVTYGSQVVPAKKKLLIEILDQFE
jgi:hypothetical protein